MKRFFYFLCKPRIVLINILYWSFKNRVLKILSVKYPKPIHRLQLLGELILVNKLKFGGNVDVLIKDQLIEGIMVEVEPNRNLPFLKIKTSGQEFISKISYQRNTLALTCITIMLGFWYFKHSNQNTNSNSQTVKKHKPIIYKPHPIGVDTISLKAQSQNDSTLQTNTNGVDKIDSTGFIEYKLDTILQK